MQRFTITIDDDLLEAVDTLMAAKGYASRSEAIRDMIRAAATQEAAIADQTPCVAILGYVYDHETRALAQRLTHTLHDHHDLSVAGMHVHLDHDTCLEVSVLRGPVGDVRGLADSLTSQRGVRHANLHVVPVAVTHDRHEHGGRGSDHTHTRA
ncbi:nickel-responsive transcriptional regulator NikR [Acidisoma cellulosilytica]|uniref:Putative nickel-responsive regulator n=1 Tax=Acidisoma cellulosilyticum TaxID=2802395 RepID=A0A963Z300_9PROT|nr:nickel-responsive transcriptional regulator NikR [Acidisoma cellulosilyticum]MCB8881661.1 nickel-responsive transcriptional regulator NikR [Acidisoma cellulosilyticum]